MSKKAPYMLIVSHLYEECEYGIYPTLVWDLLECGHAFGAKFLMPKSKTPYRHEWKDGKPAKTWRRCTKCPRVEREEVA